jgi:hypothetical protein
MASYLSASRLSARLRVLDVLIIVAIDLLLTLPVGSRRMLPAGCVWAGQLTVLRRLTAALAEVFLDVAFVALLMDPILGCFRHSSMEAGSRVTKRLNRHPTGLRTCDAVGAIMTVQEL